MSTTTKSVPSLRDTLEAAEAFVSGFEDDTSQEGVPELLRDLRAAIASDPDRAAQQIATMRAAMEVTMGALDTLANQCTNAKGELTRAFNRVVEETGCTAALSQALAGGPDPWHLFYIEASDCDGTHGYIVSAQSGSESKAKDLAENSVLDVLGTDEDPATIEHSKRLGLTDSDIFQTIGLLAEA